MTDEQMRIAIAEACGWTRIPAENVGAAARLFYGDIWWRDAENNTIASADQLPDYLNDLNAMHCAEGELLLKHPDLRQSYRRILIDCCGTENLYWRATARQRAIAFIKTLNLEPK